MLPERHLEVDAWNSDWLSPQDWQSYVEYGSWKLACLLRPSVFWRCQGLYSTQFLRRNERAHVENAYTKLERPSAPADAIPGQLRCWLLWKRSRQVGQVSPWDESAPCQRFLWAIAEGWADTRTTPAGVNRQHWTRERRKDHRGHS